MSALAALVTCEMSDPAWWSVEKVIAWFIIELRAFVLPVRTSRTCTSHCYRYKVNFDSLRRWVISWYRELYKFICGSNSKYPHSWCVLFCPLFESGFGRTNVLFFLFGSELFFFLSCQNLYQYLLLSDHENLSFTGANWIVQVENCCCWYSNDHSPVTGGTKKVSVSISSLYLDVNVKESEIVWFAMRSQNRCRQPIILE